MATKQNPKYIVMHGGEQQSRPVSKAKAQAIAKRWKGFAGENAKVVVAPKKGNPASGAAEAFAEFQGRPSKEVIEITQKVHYHENLAAAGKLEALIVVAFNGSKVTLSDFKGAILCFNEKKTQLYIKGGSQSVDLKVFGISPGNAHELETLGNVVRVDYLTTKKHLGKQGGTAIFQHKFERPYPELVYDVRNAQLMFSGGGYVILPEGIDK